MNTLNLHALFHASIEDSLENHISITSADRVELLGARTAIRAHIRAQLSKRLKAARLDEDIENILPRFITQGSYAYKTINAPARRPQRADLDDGVYVPLSFCKESGSPKAVSRLLIEVIEAILVDLAKLRGWRVDNTNPNCTRLIVASDKHVDVPIYSIPDEEFQQIARDRFGLVKDAQSFNDYYMSDRLDDDWTLMPSRVRLAHKILGWLDSDPRPIKDWVETQVALKSEQLRRIMRYLKAWRDFQVWPASDPKSLLLMALADITLERKIDGRDDLALLTICAGIPKVLAAGPVEIAPLPGEDLSARLAKDALKDELMQRIRTLHELLDQCIQGRYSPEQACRLLRDQFGPRFPNRPERIRIEAPEQTVRATAPRIITPAPIVGRREAG